MHISMAGQPIQSTCHNTSSQAVHAAQDFEAMLLTGIFKEVEESVATLSGDEDDSVSGSFRGFGVEQLATAMADSGGVGISKIIAPALTGAGAKNCSQSGEEAVPIKVFSNLADRLNQVKARGELE